MLYSYGIEAFYQVKKRDQKYPIAQLLGRTDFTLFPAAGYLCYGQPDMTMLLYIVFFYPWTMAHLGLNDFIDLKNDQARGLKSITVLYGAKKTMYWITGFTVLHFLAAVFFLRQLGDYCSLRLSCRFYASCRVKHLSLERKKSSSRLEDTSSFPWNSGNLCGFDYS